MHMDALIGEDYHCKVLGRYSQGSLQKNEKVLGCGMLINGTLVMRPRLLKDIRGGPPLSSNVYVDLCTLFYIKLQTYYICA